MAYRRADHERWQQMDFVLGIKIELSNQHPVTDICDFVQGEYPKDFVFDGWHPQCFCYATPILISEDEMAKVSEAFARGETYIPKGKPVTDTPKGFKKWVKDHKEQIQKAKNPPYWVRNNKAVVKEIWGKEKTSSLDNTVKKRRKKIKEEAKLLFKDNPLTHPLIKSSITVHNSAIKEWLNQPHADFAAKNELLLRLPDNFKKTNYLGKVRDIKNRQDVVFSHIFETDVNGKKSWIIVHEMEWGEMKLHSISDSAKVKPK